MKLKKAGIVLGTMILLLSMQMTVFAEKADDSDLGELYAVSEDMKDATPSNGSRARGPKWRGHSELYAFGAMSKSYVTAGATSTLYPIDKVEVTCKIYEKNSFKDSGYDFEYNASSVEVQVGPYAGLTAVVKREVYGSHKFTHSGYEKGVLETHVSY